ncbi:MAG: hypothetical protein HFE75_08550 [Firmicutes bacterium]|nr:hypothetical protein [Bacillota bacterium]
MQKKKRSALVLSLWVCLALLGGMITYPQTETAYAVADSVEINAANFPNNAFRAYIQEKFDPKGTGVLSAAKLQGVTAIDVSGRGISDLTGIGLFTALTSLDCSDNALTKLNVSSNTKLTSLDCGNNQLSTLSLEKNAALTTLRCFKNKLTNLDISKNIELIYLDCYENQLTELSVTANTRLTYLDCANNMLFNVTGDTSKLGEYIFAPQKKRPQTITIPESEILKTLGDTPFSLDAKLVGNPTGTLIYFSSDEDVATVDSSGTVTLKDAGTTTITIRAEATAQYHAAEATVELTVEPADEDEDQDPGDGSEDEDQDNDQDADNPSTDEPIIQPNPPAVNPTEQETNPTSGTNPTKPTTPVVKRTSAATGQKLLTLAVKAGSEKNRLTWPKIKGADGYFIYASKCNEGNKKHSLKKIKTITSGKKTTYIHKGLKKATWYKYRVDAYHIVKGKKEVFEHSLQLHSLTGGSKKYANPAKVKVTKKNVTLKKGRSTRIQANVILPKGKKTQWHTAQQLCYMVSDKTVVSVSEKGIIRAKKKGTATIYVVTQNGVRGKVTVKVK